VREGPGRPAALDAPGRLAGHHGRGRARGRRTPAGGHERAAADPRRDDAGQAAVCDGPSGRLPAPADLRTPRARRHVRLHRDRSGDARRRVRRALPAQRGIQHHVRARDHRTGDRADRDRGCRPGRARDHRAARHARRPRDGPRAGERRPGDERRLRKRRVVCPGARSARGRRRHRPGALRRGVWGRVLRVCPRRERRRAPGSRRVPAVDRCRRRRHARRRRRLPDRASHRAGPGVPLRHHHHRPAAGPRRAEPQRLRLRGRRGRPFADRHRGQRAPSWSKA
jgi:hypothetical protein